MRSIDLDFQNHSGHSTPPAESFQTWLTQALKDIRPDAELSVRIVSEEEMTQLNQQFRGINKPTNVLSFPADIPPEVEIDLLGDIIICASIVEREAQEQKKDVTAHYAHMCVHGALHLAGYDHIDDADAAQMESLEVKILDALGFSNPYIADSTINSINKPTHSSEDDLSALA